MRNPAFCQAIRKIKDYELVGKNEVLEEVVVY
jgi:hypothetical protein